MAVVLGGRHVKETEGRKGRGGERGREGREGRGDGGSSGEQQERLWIVKDVVTMLLLLLPADNETSSHTSFSSLSVWTINVCFRYAYVVIVSYSSINIAAHV